jgi:hypothetical protein
MNFKRMLLVSSPFVIGVSIGFWSILHVASERAIVKLPEKTRSCLPHQGIALAAANPRVIATARSQTTEYHLYHLQNDADEYVVTVDQSGVCKLLRFSGVTLSSQIPLPIAKQLTLGKLQKAIAYMGKPQLKQRIQQVIQQSPDKTLSPEMRWAIDQLQLL